MSPDTTAIPRIDRKVCDGCGLCVASCPSGALVLRDGVVELREGAECPFCGEWVVACPAGAIARVFRIEFASRP